MDEIDLLKLENAALKARVDNLLEDNNRYLEEGRAARRELAKVRTTVDALAAQNVDLQKPYMGLNEYQAKARDTAVYQNIGRNPRYAMIGLCEEVGEIAGQLKRVERDDNDVVTPERRTKLTLEMGDALWYMASLAAELGMSLEEIAKANLAKLADRKARKVLQGSGDAR